MTVLGIDAGTTGVTALLVTEDGRVAAKGHEDFAQHFPAPGWVEHEPEEIWQATLAAVRAVLATEAPRPRAVGLTNQRETAVLWDRRSLAAPRRAIVWQDRRTARLCDEMRERGVEDDVARRTGLRLDPYFTATKLAWLARHEPELWAAVRGGRVALGTVDSYLLARLTGGAVHATDPSNASRTLLYDLAAGEFTDELCDLFDTPRAALPEIRPSSGVLGRTDPDAFCGLDLPVGGVAGDQQAALFGQTCFAVGASKCTYGTGSFVLVHTGEQGVRSPSLLTTVAWDLGAGPRYALEGSVFVTGAAVQWLRDGLGLLVDTAESAALAASVPDAGGVVFVPALTGLGAPWWDPDARGLIVGLTRGTTRAHLVRATLEAIAYQVRDVVEVITRTAGCAVPELSVDGGASANDVLCQLQADTLGVPVRRPQVAETTALGAAFLAGLATGVWGSLDELAETWRLDRRFAPDGERAAAAVAGYRRWGEAVSRSRGWARF